MEIKNVSLIWLELLKLHMCTDHIKEIKVLDQKWNSHDNAPVKDEVLLSDFYQWFDKI